MESFLSQHCNRFDAKGRISLPATFRAALSRPGFDGVFLFPSLDAPALDGGGQSLIGEIQALLDALPLYSPEREDLATALLSTGETLKLDAEGRMIIPDRLRTAAHLGDEAMFAGQGRKFQIWEPQRFRAHLDAARTRAREWRANFGKTAGAQL